MSLMDKKPALIVQRLFSLLMVAMVGPWSPLVGQDPGSQQPIIVGFNRDFPPFEFLDAKGQPAGYDIDLIRAAAAEAELPLVFQADTWEHIKAGVEAGRIDVLPGMLYSDQRAALVDFSAPHLLVHYCIFVRKGTQGVAALGDLRGRKILVEHSSRMHEQLLKQGFGAEAIPVASEPEALRVLSSKREFDAAILPRLEGLQMIHDLRLANIQPLPGSILTEELCIAVAKGRGRLLAKLESGVAILHGSGKYREIYDKWMAPLEPERGLSPHMIQLLGWSAIAVLALVTLSLTWSWSLRKQVYQRTRALRKSEEATRASNAKFQAIFDTTNDAIFIHDLVTGAILDVNQRAADLHGYTQEELLAGDLDSLGSGVPPYTREDALGWIQKAAREGPQSFEWQARTKSGRLIWGEVKMRKAVIDGRERLIVSVRDITQRKGELERIRSSEDKFNKVFHHAPLLASLTRLADGALIDVNERYCEVLGFSREEAIGRTTVELGILKPEDRARVIQALQLGGRVQNLESTLYAKDGQSVVCLISGEVVDVGEVPLLVSMVIDVTAIKEAEAIQRKLELELLQSQKLESLGSLAGGVAHDMNNVLAAIQAVAQVLKLMHAGNEELVKSLDTIEKATTRGITMVKSLTNFARKDLHETMPLDLNSLVRQEMELLRHTTLEKVGLVMDLEEPLPLVVGERGTLGSALMNLCVNAVDAMPRGGTLTLRTRSLPDAQVELEVQDSGEGMPPAVLARAMEPFFTTKPVGKGTGLGLSLVYATAKAHGGRAFVQSEVGKGTSVFIHLPVSQTGGNQEEPAGASFAQSGSMRILLVDDDELIRASVPTMLELFGHRVVTAASGTEALELLAKGSKFNLVILDLNMPEMNGADTLRHLRRLEPDLPVILATGHLDAATADLLIQDGSALSISKPFSMAELERKLKELAALL
jgi:PAS domain S-box-containing protein